MKSEKKVQEMSTEQQETQELYAGNAKEQDKQESNTELIEEKEITDTPFKAVRHDKDWFVALNRYRISGSLASYEECVEDAKDVTWKRLIDVMSIVNEIQAQVREMKK